MKNVSKKLRAILAVVCMIIGEGFCLLSLSSCNGNVDRTITQISVKTQPAKTTYVQYDELLPDGLVITVAYSDGTEEDVAYNDSSSDFYFSIYSFEKAGNIKVTVTYKNKTADFTVTVTEYVEKYEAYIKKQPYKLEYLSNQSLDLKGLVVCVYNTRTYQEFMLSYPDTAFTYDVDMTTPGTKNVTLNFEYAKTQYTVTLKIKVTDSKKTVTFGNYTFSSADAGKDITITLPVDEKGNTVKEVDIISLYNFKKEIQEGIGPEKPASVSFKDSDFTKDTVYNFTLPSDETNIDIMRSMVNPLEQGLKYGESKSVEIIPGIAVETKYAFDDGNDKDVESYLQTVNVFRGTLNIDASKSKYNLYGYNGGVVKSNDANIKVSNIENTTLTGYMLVDDNSIKNIMPIMFSGDKLPIIDGIEFISRTSEPLNIYGTDLDKLVKKYYTTAPEKIKSAPVFKYNLYFSAKEYLNGNDMWDANSVYQNNAYEIDVNFASLIPTAGVEITGNKITEEGYPIYTSNSLLKFDSEEFTAVAGAGIVEIDTPADIGYNGLNKLLLRSENEKAGFSSLVVDFTDLTSFNVYAVDADEEYIKQYGIGTRNSSSMYVNGKMESLGSAQVFLDATNHAWQEKGWEAINNREIDATSYKYVPAPNKESPNYQRALDLGWPGKNEWEDDWIKKDL